MLCLCEIIGCVAFIFISNDPANLISENLCSGSVVAITYSARHLNSMDGWRGGRTGTKTNHQNTMQ